MPRSDKIRCQFFLPKAVNDRFEAVAAKPGVSKSAIFEEALTAFLDRKGDNEIELRFVKRLDQFSKQLDRVELKINVIQESLTLFIRYVLSAIEPAPERDEAAHAAGRERFVAFVEPVRKQLASVGVTVDTGTLQ